ncbi:MAG: MFS transporter, partial [Gammaproteobacteria bacterium]|nr:MFS transporter [Gammaproteobacteria bacterium]
AFIVLLAQQRGASVAGILGMVLMFNLVYTAVSTPAGALSDRIGRRRLIVGGWLLYAIVYLGFALSSAAWHVWALYAVYGFYYGMAYGTAKAVVADLVPAAARGTAVAAHVDPRAAAEAAREHAWKLLVDWPKAMGLAPDEVMFIRVAKAVPGAAGDLAAEFRAHPLLVAMAGALAPDGVDAEWAARIVARRDVLAVLLSGGASPAGTVAAVPLGPGRGRATVETARGELRHEITLDSGARERIAAYRIVAPTDRLFAADGPLPGWLVGLEKVGAGDTARRAVLALDPCVPWDLELV